MSSSAKLRSMAQRMRPSFRNGSMSRAQACTHWIRCCSERVRKVTPISFRRLSQSCSRSSCALRPPSLAMFTYRPPTAMLCTLASNTGAPTWSITTSTPRFPVADITCSTCDWPDESIPTPTPTCARRASFSAERDIAITGRAGQSAAICSAAQATPPDAPLTRIDSPGCNCPLVITASCAVMNAFGNDAASIQETVDGTGMMASGSARTNCAWHARPCPMTRSPSRHAVTSLPTSATSPANSTPTVIGSPARLSLACVISPRLSPDARARTSTWPGPTVGRAISCTSMRPPSGCAMTLTAFMYFSKGCRLPASRGASAGTYRFEQREGALRGLACARVRAPHIGRAQVFDGAEGRDRLRVGHTQPAQLVHDEKVGVHRILRGLRGAQPMQIGIEPVGAGEHRRLDEDFMLVQAALAHGALDAPCCCFMVLGLHGLLQRAEVQRAKAVQDGHALPVRLRAGVDDFRCRLAALAHARIAVLFDALHRVHHLCDILGNRGLDHRAPDMQHIAERAELRHQAAVGLRHQVDTRLHRVGLHGIGHAAAMKRRIDGMRARHHGGPEPELEIIQRVEPRPQPVQLDDLVQMTRDLHDFTFRRWPQL